MCLLRSPYAASGIYGWPDSIGAATSNPTAATTQKQFEEACRHFDYDRSRWWYMEIAQSDQDILIGISKVNFKIFKPLPIRRGDDFFNQGKDKGLDLPLNTGNFMATCKSKYYVSKSTNIYENGFFNLNTKRGFNVLVGYVIDPQMTENQRSVEVRRLQTVTIKPSTNAMNFKIKNEHDKAVTKERSTRSTSRKESHTTSQFPVKRSIRTISQHRLYWLWVTCIEQETGNDKETLHEYFKQEFLGRQSVQIFNTEVYPLRSTTGLNTKEFTDYLNKIQVFASSELGIVLPNPIDLQFQPVLWKNTRTFYNNKKEFYKWKKKVEKAVEVKNLKYVFTKDEHITAGSELAYANRTLSGLKDQKKTVMANLNSQISAQEEMVNMLTTKRWKRLRLSRRWVRNPVSTYLNGDSKRS